MIGLPVALMVIAIGSVWWSWLQFSQGVLATIGAVLVVLVSAWLGSKAASYGGNGPVEACFCLFLVFAIGIPWILTGGVLAFGLGVGILTGGDWWLSMLGTALIFLAAFIGLMFRLVQEEI